MGDGSWRGGKIGGVEAKELKRVEGVQAYPAFHTRCEGCGREITLFYNGGELDHAECCGRGYWLESPRTDFVVYEDPPPAAK
jgi:hypothetical protein